MNIAENLNRIKNDLPDTVRFVAVSKFHPVAVIREAYDAGQRIFGENRVQEIVSKHEQLPQDIEWHFIGHLQANKVRYLVPFVDTIHSIDSEKLLNEVQKEAQKCNRKIKVLLQIHIAQEEHKFGFSFEEAETWIQNNRSEAYPNLILSGLMGMATFTDNQEQIRREFQSLATFYRSLKETYFSTNNAFKELSMGMSDDYPIAIEEGSTLVRIGTKIFGERNSTLFVYSR
jgi:pyridoxal phosphate enzyme (YggS family)